MNFVPDEMCHKTWSEQLRVKLRIFPLKREGGGRGSSSYSAQNKGCIRISIGTSFENTGFSCSEDCLNRVGGRAIVKTMSRPTVSWVAANLQKTYR